MKDKSIFAAVLLFVLLHSFEVGGQSVIERELICASGDQFSVGPVSLSWSMGEFMADNIDAGNIIFIQGFQQSNGCFAKGQVIVEVDTLDCVQKEVKLSITTTVVSPRYTWRFPSGDTTSQKAPIVTVPGIYMLTIRDEKGCRRDTLIEVIQDISDPQFELSVDSDTLTCLREEISIELIPATGSSAVTWTDESMNVIASGNILTIQKPGTFTANLYGLNGCLIDTSIAIIANVVKPVITLVKGDTLDCSADSIQLMSQSTIGLKDFQWYDPQNNPLPPGPNAFVSQPGLFRLEVTDLVNGCSSDSTFEVIASLDLPDLQVEKPPLLTCRLDSVILLAQSASPGVKAIWYQGSAVLDTSFQYPVSIPGLYTIVIFDPMTGCDVRANVTVLQDTAAPLLSAQDALIDCMHPEVNLEVISMATEELDYTWISPGGDIQPESGAILEVSEPGIWQIIAENEANGCMDTVSILVERDVSLPDIVAELAPIDCFDKTATLNGGSMTPGVQFIWLDQDGHVVGDSPSILVDRSGVFTLEVVSPDGCRSTQHLEVQLGPTYQLPTVITPNGDGKNDQLVLEFCGELPIGPITLTVFNRWGQEVYFSSQYDHSWGGDANGLQLPDGQYYYIVVLEGFKVKQTLSILR